MDKSLIDRLVVCHYQMAAAAAAAEKEDIWPCVGYKNEIQIGCGNIEKLAKSADAEVRTDPRDDEEYPVEKSFSYRGIKFFEIFKANHES